MYYFYLTNLKIYDGQFDSVDKFVLFHNEVKIPTRILYQDDTYAVIEHNTDMSYHKVLSHNLEKLEELLLMYMGLKPISDTEKIQILIDCIEVLKLI